MKKIIYTKTIVISIVLLLIGSSCFSLVFIARGEEYNITLYPPWPEWDNYHSFSGAGYDNGFEAADSYGTSIIVNHGVFIIGETTLWQICWHNITWHCPHNGWYTFTFDYDYDGWGKLVGWTFWGDCQQIIGQLFFDVYDSPLGWGATDRVLSYYRTFLNEMNLGVPLPIPIPIPSSKTVQIRESTEHIASSPVYFESGGEKCIRVGQIIYSNCAAALGGAGVGVNLYGRLNYVKIEEDTSVAPVFRVSPNPPYHDFGERHKEERSNFSFNIWNGGIDILSWTVSDDKDWIEVSPTSGSSTGEVDPINVTIDTTGLSVGYHSGHVTVNTPYGDTTGLIEVEVINIPPVANANGPYYANAGDIITFDASSSYDLYGTITDYRWDWENDGSWDTDWSSSPTATHRFSENGLFTSKLEVKDDDGGTNTDLCASHIGYSWERDVVDAEGFTGIFSSLAMDSNNHPHIAYVNFDDLSLKYAHWDGSTWQRETIDYVGGSGANMGYTSIAIDSNDDPHIAYLGGTPWEYPTYLNYAHKPGSSWIIEDDVVSEEWTGIVPSIVLDSHDRPHIAHQKYVQAQSYHYPMYTYWTGYEWISESVDATGDNTGFRISLALDNNNKPHMSYQDLDNYNLMYARKPGSHWEIQLIDSDEDTGYDTSIACDSDNNPHISYCNGVHVGDEVLSELRYVYSPNGGSSWNSPEIIQSCTGSYDALQYSSIAVDSDDYPHISYHFFGSLTQDDELKYAVKLGSSWTVELVDNENGADSAIDLDHDDIPHMSYWDSNMKALRYASLGEGTNSPPYADANGPYNGELFENIIFDASGSIDFDGEIIGYRWDWENDGEWDTDWSISPTSSNFYLESGTYTVKLAVKDDEETRDTDLTTVEIPEDTIPPTIHDDTPSTTSEGDEFTFSATITDNIEVANVYVEYWFDSQPPMNLSMGKTSPDVWEKTILIERDRESLFYVISAKDTAGNWADTGINEVPIPQTDHPPYIPSNPTPSNNSIAISLETGLSWNGGDPDSSNSVYYDIYLEANDPVPQYFDTIGPYAASQTRISYDIPGRLEDFTDYYWKIVARDNDPASPDAIGPVWTFKTRDTVPPEWRHQGQNKSYVTQGQPILLSAQARDNVALDWAWLATNETGIWQNFTGGAGHAWWNDNWNYRKQIIIDHTQVDGDLTNFPILIAFTSPDFYDHTQADGDDFVFVDRSNSVKYNHEIEDYNPLTGELIAWVNVTDLSGSEDTRLYVYYGNPICGNQENIEDTWDSDFLAVWHMHDSSGGITDSTESHYLGTEMGTPSYRQSGEFGPSIFFSGDDGFNLGDNCDIDDQDFTFEIKYKTPTYADQYRYFFNKRGTSGHGYDIYTTTGGQGFDIRFYAEANNEEDIKVETGDGTLGDDEWHHYWCKKIGNTVYATIDNGLFTAQNSDDVDTFETDGILYIGTMDGSRSFKGSIEELRISYGLARSDEWLSTSYNNMKNPDMFITVRDEETLIQGGEEAYGSPLEMEENDEWQWSNFSWQNPGIPVGTHVGWRIYYEDINNNINSTEILSFIIGEPPNQPPYQPSTPDPFDGETNVEINHDLFWTGGDPDPGDTVTYDIYFDTTNPPSLLVTDHAETSYDPGILSYSTTYFWQIVAWDNHGASSVSDIWTFSTESGDVDPDQSFVTLTGEDHFGMTTCPAGDGSIYKYVTITVKDVFGLPMPGIASDNFEFTVTAQPGTHYFRTLSCSFTAVDLETDANGEIRFDLQGDTSITGELIIEVTVLGVDLNDVDYLLCNSYDYYISETIPQDGIVSLQDFSQFASDYGTMRWQSDFNWDHLVDLVDFSMFASHYSHYQIIPEYTLTITVVGSGSVIVDPDQPTYPDGSLVMLTAIPDPEWTFSHWSGDIIGSANPRIIIMNRNKTIIANFIAVGDELDQEQILFQFNNFKTYTDYWCGQAFTPSLETLTRVEVFIGKTGSPPTDLCVSIRATPTGADLTEISVPASEISLSMGWVEFDFDDIDVIPGNMYCINMWTRGGSSSDYYMWGYSDGDPYSDGMMGYSSDAGLSWDGFSDYDFCFKTYGMS